jgi:hypothetical protein
MQYTFNIEGLHQKMISIPKDTPQKSKYPTNWVCCQCMKQKDEGQLLSQDLEIFEFFCEDCIKDLQFEIV